MIVHTFTPYVVGQRYESDPIYLNVNGKTTCHRQPFLVLRTSTLGEYNDYNLEEYGVAPQTFDKGTLFYEISVD